MSEGNRRKPDVSVWEWVVAGASAVLVLGAIAFLALEAMRGTEQPPSVQVSADSIVALPLGFLVQFTAQNQGDATAAAVTIEGELRSDTGSVERATATIDYVPEHGRASGGLFFRNDPGRFRLDLRATGYHRP